jgi:glycosyltransferase involved in cell wall biosynthesis
VLYPPVDLDRYYNDGDDGHFLHLGRLDKEKGVQEVVEAFTGIDERLVLAGGRGDVDEDMMRRIERTENVDYRGFVSESEKYDLLGRSRAVVFNGRNEDFGIVLVEANASGKPVLAIDEGFPSVFIEDGENGLLHDGTPAGIRATLTGADFTVPEESTEQFGLDHFGKQLRQEIQTSLEEIQI